MFDYGGQVERKEEGGDLVVFGEQDLEDALDLAALGSDEAEGDGGALLACIVCVVVTEGGKEGRREEREREREREKKEERGTRNEERGKRKEEREKERAGCRS
eukprot:763427-Rhodomonas_salina.1